MTSTRSRGRLADATSIRDLRPLRIAQIAPPGIPCPPAGYGASELVAGNLTNELVRRGHAVTLFAHPDSPTAARLVSFPAVYDIASAEQREVAHSSLALDHAGDYDVIHNHCILPGASLTRHAPAASLTTLHYLRPILATFATEPYVAVSRAQAGSLSHLNVVGIAHNGVDLGGLPFAAEKSDYLLFLGRIDPKKAPHLAIDIARRAGRRLIVAAPHPSRDNLAYFETEVKPRFGGSIEYVGHVSGAEKARLLGGARGVLMPQQWEEPFGLVAAEAMACGTPVIALRRGALPEIVCDGVTGFVVDHIDDMVEAVDRLGAIDPLRCRRVVEERFTASAMAEAYLRIYRCLIDRQTGQQDAASADPKLAEEMAS